MTYLEVVETAQEWVVECHNPFCNHNGGAIEVLGVGQTLVVDEGVEGNVGLLIGLEMGETL